MHEPAVGPSVHDFERERLARVRDLGVHRVCPPTPTVVDAIQASLAPRGPDAAGVMVDGDVVLGHRRLAIIDLDPRSNQPPLASPDGRLVLSFNGEIYNFPDLRRVFGATAMTHPSDTHVLLEAWQHWGPGALPRLHGMFAFALWDRGKRELHLARDRYGIKPLYVASDGSRLVFVSEIGAIRRLVADDGCRDAQALLEYLHFGNPLDDRTFYSAVRSVAPGTHLRVHDGHVTTAPFTALHSTNPCRNYPEAVEQTRALVEVAVERHLISDRPLAIFLSGGLDSTTIAHVAAQRHDVHTVTARFDRVETFDTVQARATSARLGSTHTEVDVDHLEAFAFIERLARHHGQPFGDAAGVPLLALCDLVASDYQVVLQGDGGDELFGGYRRHQLFRALDILHLRPTSRVHLPAPTWLPYRARRFIEAATVRSIGAMAGQLLSGLTTALSPVEFLQTEVRAALVGHDPYTAHEDLLARRPASGLVEAIMRVEFDLLLRSTYLEKVDRATMAASVEARVPFLDNPLVDFVQSLPTAWKVGPLRTKRLLRDVVSPWVPPVVASAPKAGFGTPVDRWMQGELGTVLESLLGDGPTAGLVDERAVRRLLESHRAAGAPAGAGLLLYRLLQLLHWSADEPAMSWA